MKKVLINSNLDLIVDRNQIHNRATGKKINMEPRLTKILTILLEYRGKVVSRTSLIEPIWGNYNSGEELLTHSISMLRKQLGTDLIETIPKKGYLIESSTVKMQPKASFKFKNYYWFLLVGVLLIIRMTITHH